MTTTVQVGQTLLDVAVQRLGGADQVVSLATANGLDITAAVTPGQVLTLPTVTGQKYNRVVRFLADGGHVPATNYIAEELEGIDFWDIEGDFIVS